jgi:hypothetical protein
MAAIQVLKQQSRCLSTHHMTCTDALKLASTAVWDRFDQHHLASGAHCVQHVAAAMKHKMLGRLLVFCSGC